MSLNVVINYSNCDSLEKKPVPLHLTPLQILKNLELYTTDYQDDYFRYVNIFIYSGFYSFHFS